MNGLAAIELKASVLQEVGCSLDDAREAALVEQHQAEGASVVLGQVAKQIEELAASIEKDIDEGKLDLEQAKVIKGYITRASSVAHVHQAQAENLRIRATGKVAAFEISVKDMKKKYDASRSQLEAVHVAATSGVAPSAPSVGDPGRHLTLKTRRLAEEVAQQAAQVPAPAPKKALGRRKKAGTNGGNS